MQHASPWLFEKKQLSDEYAAFTATGITKRVKLLHITTAEKKIRLDNLHAQTNNQHESQDYRNPNMYMLISSSKRNMPVHDCLKRSSSVMNMLFTTTGITERCTPPPQKRHWSYESQFLHCCIASVQTSLRFVVLRKGFTRNWDEVQGINFREPVCSAVLYRYKEGSSSANQLDNSGPSSPHNVQWLGKSHSEGTKTWLRQGGLSVYPSIQTGWQE